VGIFPETGFDWPGRNPKVAQHADVQRFMTLQPMIEIPDKLTERGAIPGRPGALFVPSMMNDCH